MYRTENALISIKGRVSDKDIFPICIPSYNRVNSTLLRKLYNQGYGKEIYLFIRKEQYSMYEKYAKRFSTIKLKNAQDAGTTRRSIVNYAKHRGWKYIFMLDDDICMLDWVYPDYTKNGHLCLRPRSTNLGEPYTINKDAFKLWVNLMQNNPDVVLSGAALKSNHWHEKYIGKPLEFNSGYCLQNICLNIEKLKELEINYQSNKICGIEDYRLQFDILEAGGKTLVYRDLFYDCSSSVGSGSGGFEYKEEVKNHYNKVNEIFLKSIGGSHPAVSFRTTKSKWQSIKLNWSYWSTKEKVKGIPYKRSKSDEK